MRKALLTLFAAFAAFAGLALLAGTSHAQPPAPAPKIILPDSPPVVQPLGTPTKLGSDTLYVFQSNASCLVLTSPDGPLKVTSDVGPMRIRAKFVDGDGTYQTRLFAEKFIYSIEAVGVGLAEVIIVPAGTTAEKDVVRRMIDAQGKPVPPTPKDPPVPPSPKVTKHLTFIGLTADAAPVINDQALRVWLKSVGVAVHALSALDPFVKSGGLQVSVDKAGLPCIVLQDADGGIIDQTRLTTSAAATEFVKSHLGK